MAKRDLDLPWAPTRRDFLKAAGLSALTLDMLWASATAATAPSESTGKRRPNILVILTDQERYLDTLPPGYSLPGHERLLELGTSFTNHQIASCVCTSSRSNIYTGQHIAHTRMFDNMAWPWVQNLSTEIPTIGHMLRELGYYSAYQGKFHMSRELEEHQPKDAPKLIGRETMDAYGFSDYTGVGDIIGNTLGGYLNDAWIAAFSNRWLRERGQSLNAAGTPWFIAVNFVNPHDVMYFNTDEPGKPVQKEPWLLAPIAREPDYGIYKQEWDHPLPATRNQAWDAANRPKSHFNYQAARGGILGVIPDEDDRWRRLQNYYFNCIQDVDRHIQGVVDELEALGMLENTIILHTADHGELAGAHGMSGKGATAYREQNHVPLHIVHPDVEGGRTCDALTSHLDLPSTILSMAQGHDSKTSDMLDRLKGRDFSGVLSDPADAGVNDVRDATLYCYNMFSYYDPDFILDVAKTIQTKGKKDGLADLQRRRVKPDLKSHRGAIRSVFDGRYKFSRYFSSLEFNHPENLKQLTMANDIELFDHETDPNEADNLAGDLSKNRDLILAMNAKLNAIIGEEIGSEDGSFMGLQADTSYAFNEVDV